MDGDDEHNDFVSLRRKEENEEEGKERHVINERERETNNKKSNTDRISTEAERWWGCRHESPRPHDPSLSIFAVV